MTRTPSARAATTRARKCGLSSGAPPVRSSVSHSGAGGEEGQHGVDGLARHLLGAVRPGIDVAVHAALVAAVAEIDLQGFDGTPAQRREIGGEQGKGGVHGYFRVGPAAGSGSAPASYSAVTVAEAGWRGGATVLLRRRPRRQASPLRSMLRNLTTCCRARDLTTRCRPRGSGFAQPALPIRLAIGSFSAAAPAHTSASTERPVTT